MIAFELPMGALIANYKGAAQDILSLAPMPDGKHLLGGGDDTELRQWSLETGLEIKSFHGKGHIGSIAALAVTRDGSTAAERMTTNPCGFGSSQMARNCAYFGDTRTPDARSRFRLRRRVSYPAGTMRRFVFGNCHREIPARFCGQN